MAGHAVAVVQNLKAARRPFGPGGEVGMNPILKKLFFKGQSPVLLLGAPAEFKKTAASFGVPVHSQPKGSYDFVLAFVHSLAEAEKAAKAVSKALSEKGVFWMAYPKGTSRKYQSDINRDKGHALMQERGFDGVSLIAIDEDWSAMRFKPLPASP